MFIKLNFIFLQESVQCCWQMSDLSPRSRDVQKQSECGIILQSQDSRVAGVWSPGGGGPGGRQRMPFWLRLSSSLEEKDWIRKGGESDKNTNHPSVHRKHPSGLHNLLTHTFLFTVRKVHFLVLCWNLFARTQDNLRVNKTAVRSPLRRISRHSQDSRRFSDLCNGWRNSRAVADQAQVRENSEIVSRYINTFV